ncbi:hypothetical protein N7461_000645 [Penicillium sp. DV-2018c]|nr:hypothetical protein N7461_000645 [Penicillium sp. DV-2018c]
MPAHETRFGFDGFVVGAVRVWGWVKSTPFAAKLTVVMNGRNPLAMFFAGWHCSCPWVLEIFDEVIYARSEGFINFSLISGMPVQFVGVTAHLCSHGTLMHAAAFVYGGRDDAVDTPISGGVKFSWGLGDPVAE